MKIADDYYKVCPDAIPEGLVDWAIREVLPKDKTITYKRGNVRGYCFCCGEFIKPDIGIKFHQGYYAKCPACGVESICYPEFGKSWRCDYIANVATIQKAQDGSLWIRQYHITRGVARGIAEKNFIEIGRYCLTGNPADAAKWLHENKDVWGMRVERYWCDEWTRNKKISDIYDGNDYFYFPENFKDMIKGTCLEYYSVDSLFEGSCIRSMLDWGRYPALEKLYKAGYYTLVCEKVRGAGSRKIGWKQKTIEKALRIPLWILKTKRPVEWSSVSIERMQRIYAMYKSGLIKKEEIEAVSEWRFDVSILEDVLKYSSYPKVLAYAEKTLKQSMSVWQSNSILSDWRDYLGIAEELGMDMKNRRILFPNNLKVDHDKLVARRKARENKELSKAITSASKKLEKYDYSFGGLLIRPARSWEELFEEGSYNHHCVETYSRRMAKGETAIFFVRKADAQDIPYFTLELRDKTVMQCRTKNNKSYTEYPEVKKFVDKWHQEKVLHKKAAAI